MDDSTPKLDLNARVADDVEDKLKTGTKLYTVVKVKVKVKVKMKVSDLRQWHGTVLRDDPSGESVKVVLGPRSVTGYRLPGGGGMRDP